MRTRAIHGVIAAVGLGLTTLAFQGSGVEATGGPGREELVISQQADADTLDPTSSGSNEARAILLQVFDPLFHAQPDGSIDGLLAKSWEFNDDGTVLTIELHPGVTFQNGAPVDAEAAKFTIERMQDPAIWPPAALLGSIESVEAPTATTLVLNLNEPDALILGTLADNVFPVDPEDTETRPQEERATQPNGSGAYRVVKWTRDDALELEAVEDYWRGDVTIPRVVFRPIPDDNTRITALLTGETDLVTRLPFDQLDQIEANPDLQVLSAEANSPYWIGLQTNSDGPLSDVRVRQALNYAIDKQAIIDSLLGGQAVVLSGPVPPDSFGYADIEPYAYDPDMAKKLLAEAGYPDGFEMQFDWPVNGLGPKTREVGTAVVEYLEDTGSRSSRTRWNPPSTSSSTRRKS